MDSQKAHVDPLPLVPLTWIIFILFKSSMVIPDRSKYFLVIGRLRWTFFCRSFLTFFNVIALVWRELRAATASSYESLLVEFFRIVIFIVDENNKVLKNKHCWYLWYWIHPWPGVGWDVTWGRVWAQLTSRNLYRDDGHWRGAKQVVLCFIPSSLSPDFPTHVLPPWRFSRDQEYIHGHHLSHEWCHVLSSMHRDWPKSQLHILCCGNLSGLTIITELVQSPVPKKIQFDNFFWFLKCGTHPKGDRYLPLWISFVISF